MKCEKMNYLLKSYRCSQKRSKKGDRKDVEKPRRCCNGLERYPNNVLLYPIEPLKHSKFDDLHTDVRKPEYSKAAQNSAQLDDFDSLLLAPEQWECS